MPTAVTFKKTGVDVVGGKLHAFTSRVDAHTQFYGINSIQFAHSGPSHSAFSQRCYVEMAEAFIVLSSFAPV